MKAKLGTRLFSIIVLITVVTLLAGEVQPRTPISPQQMAYIEPMLLSGGENLSVIVSASDAQTAAHAVERAGGQVTSDLWLINSVAAQIPATRLKTLAADRGIRSIVANKGVKASDGPTWTWDGYVTNMRVEKARFTLASTQYNPVAYLPDDGFVSLDDKGNVLIISADGTWRGRASLAGGPFYTAPVVLGSNGTVYIAGQSLRLYALNPDGSTLWQFAVNGSLNKFLGGAALGPDGTVYAADSGRWLYALNGATGQVRWRLKVGTLGAVIATPTIGPDGTVYLVTDKGYVHAVSSSGTLKWSYNTAVSLSLSPVLGPNGSVYVVQTGGKLLFALNAATGILRWKFATAGAIRARPTVGADGSVYLASEPGLYRLNADGTQRFCFPASGGMFKTAPVLSADGKTVYAAVSGSNLFAIDTTTGAKQWMYVVPGTIQASPALSTLGEVIVGSDANWIVILNPDGTVATSKHLSDQITQSASASPTGNVTVRVGTSALITLGLLPNTWDGRPDVQPATHTEYKLVYPEAIDVGADVLHNTLTANEYIRGAGITIAVVDSGIYYSPETISVLTGRTNRTFLGQADYVQPVCAAKSNGTLAGIQNSDYCFIDPPNRMYSRDGYGHGTHVAGIIWNNLTDANTGVYMGIAPEANVLSVRVLGDDGTGTYETVIKGIQWVVQNQATYNIRVLNLSLSASPTTPYFVDPLNRAAERAWASGIVVVAAAGNSGPAAETITVPGNDPYVITVGAVNGKRTPGYWGDDIVPAWSATGPTMDGFVKPDVLAPGSQIVSFMYNACRTSSAPADCVTASQALVQMHPDYSATATLFRMNGTSMATGIASGVVALMLQAHPELTPDQVKFRLMYSAWPAFTDTGEPVYNIFQQGAGRIWAPEAVLGEFAADSQANLGMDINADLAHGWETDADLAYHYAGPIMQLPSDDGQAYLYYVEDGESGNIIGLGTVRKIDMTWMDPGALVLDLTVWSGRRMLWAGGLSLDTSQTVWSGRRMLWAGGLSSDTSQTVWSGRRMLWAGGLSSDTSPMVWSGRRMLWAGGQSASSCWTGLDPTARVYSTTWVGDEQ